MGQKFVVQMLDASTDCIVEDILFDVELIEDIINIIDKSANINDLIGGYYIDREEFLLIADKFNLDFKGNYNKYFVRVADKFDMLPYKIHNGRELRMMLNGKKPMAVFSENVPPDLGLISPEPLFDRYVGSGHLVKSEFTLLENTSQAGDSKKIRYIIYTLRHEEWRAKAYELIILVGRKTGWNDSLELMEGSLLGYQDWENEEWLKAHYERCAGWACITLYTAITDQTLSQLIDLGMRAFPEGFPLEASTFYRASEPAKLFSRKRGLLNKGESNLARFGVRKSFFEEKIKQVSAGDPAAFSVDGVAGIKELNNALVTNIQLIKPS